MSGGIVNEASGEAATVAGGDENTADGQYSTVGGGWINTADGQYSTVCGGNGNTATGKFSMVCGGRGNVAAADYSFAAGSFCKIAPEHSGSFLFSCRSGGQVDFESVRDDEFAVRVFGGARFVTGGNDSRGNPRSGVQLAPGGSSWSSLSDREAKENFLPVDGQEILTQLAEVPITSWNFLAQDLSIRHLGPMAQDFNAAFGLGEDERYINNSDVNGVALVSIQALYKLILEKDNQIDALQAQIDELCLALRSLSDLVMEPEE